MNLITQLQKLEPGNQVMLLELDGSEFGYDVLRFHGHAIPHTPEEIATAGANADQLPAKSLWWQGQEYAAWPIQLEGLEVNSDGTASRPRFSAGNIDNRLSALCLATQDLADFKLTIRETLAEYLDARNFPVGNPSADPSQEMLQVWYVDQKASEDAQTITWELATPGDSARESIGRQMTTLCHWSMTGGYRGADCGYTGAARFDERDEVTSDPAKDRCGGRLSSCERRFGEHSELSHGGFPAVSMIARS